MIPLRRSSNRIVVLAWRATAIGNTKFRASDTTVCSAPLGVKRRTCGGS
jgi:hypothetical protein